MSRFPLVLYSVLQGALTDPELAEIVSWELSGTAFRIHDQKSFVEKVFPRYFPGMKSYCSLRRQLNLYGILIQSNDLSPPAESARKNGGLILQGVSSSGVYSHPFLRQDRLDLAAIIPRTGIPRRTRVPQPPRGSQFSGGTYFIDDTTRTSSATTHSCSSTTGITPTSGTTTAAATTRTTADAALYATTLPKESPESPNNMTDYYYPDKFLSTYKNYDIRTTTSKCITTCSRVIMASCPETKHRMTFPPKVVMAALDHAELTARFFLSPMNENGGELRLDDHQQHHYFPHSSSSSYRNSTVIPTSTVLNHADDHDDVTTTWINDPRKLPLPSLLPVLLRDSTTTTSTILSDEDIRFEIIQTFCTTPRVVERWRQC